MKNSISNIVYRKSKAGFTLIEILVVLAIVGILAGIIVTNLDVVRRSRDSQRKSDLLKIQTALEQYKADNGEYPWQVSDNIPKNCNGGVSFGNPTCEIIYLNKVPVDPANNLDDFYITAWGWPAQYYYNRLSPSTYVLKGCLEAPKEGDPNIQGPFGSGNPSDGGFDPDKCRSNKAYRLTNP